jgi:hypothetical protein
MCVTIPTGCKKNASPRDLQSGSDVRRSALQSSNPDAAQNRQRECRDEAKISLGTEAEVVRCGELNTPGILEVVAVLPAKFPPSKETGLTIQKLVILRREPTGWRTALTAFKDIQNDAGYVGIDFIDDTSPSFGYRVDFSDQKGGFGISFLYIENANGADSGWPIEVDWNPDVGRYQEWAFGQNPEGFRPEIENPPHWKPGLKLPSN